MMSFFAVRFIVTDVTHIQNLTQLNSTFIVVGHSLIGSSLCMFILLY
jgi:hypothetical protein